MIKQADQGPQSKEEAEESPVMPEDANPEEDFALDVEYKNRSELPAHLGVEVEEVGVNKESSRKLKQLGVWLQKRGYKVESEWVMAQLSEQ